MVLYKLAFVCLSSYYSYFFSFVRKVRSYERRLCRAMLNYDKSFGYFIQIKELLRLDLVVRI
jgi:hypothetical protein